MVEYPGTAWAGVSPNRSDRQGKVRLFIVHHYAGTQDPASARARFMAPNDRSVSPNYQVNADGSVYEIVPPDRYRAWTTGTIDHQAVTCETQNTTGAPTWGISRESHEAIARLVAWAAQRYGFPIQRGRVDAGDVVTVPGVVGHRETPAGRQTGTACPGPSMDIDWIINRAQQIAAGIPAAQPEEDDMYDQSAQDALFQKIEAETRPYKTYQKGSGLILMGDGGAVYTIPSQAYQALLIAQGLTSAHVQRIIDDNELAFIRSIRSHLSPDPREAQVQAILSLSDEDVARIAAAVPDPVVMLNDEQLVRIADAARTGGADAIRELSFVVTAS